MQVNKINFLSNNYIKKEDLLFKPYKLYLVKELKYGHQSTENYNKKHKC
jgi:hypothetical protein